MSTTKKPIAAALGAAFLAASVAPLASAESNPFTANQLSGGYDLANYAGHKEGGCGAETGDDDGKGHEGSCGDGKAESKKAEGKCGEGKCGDSKEAEAKSGEGKCGGEKKDAEGKCGG